MKSLRYLLTLALINATAITSGIFPTYAQEASVVRATQVDGVVTRNGTALKEGEVIQRGDKIVTPPKTAATLTWTNGTMVKIYPNTSLTVRGVSFENDRKMEKSYLTFYKGRLFAKAQVPEHLFKHFEINVHGVTVMAQAAEFALKYSPQKETVQVYALIGTVLLSNELDRISIGEGQQGEVIAARLTPPTPLAAKIATALMKTSRKMGGSLLIEDESTSTGGPLKVKIGGVRNRRGNVPYTVKFRAVVKGGSGNTKRIQWDFGDGESAQGNRTEHTFTQGVYGVTLVVEDENGEKASAQINISVEEDCDC